MMAEHNANVQASNSECYINSVPEDILIKIFKNFSQNELGRLSQVCKTWNRIAKSPVLWHQVDVKFKWSRGSQNKVASDFAEKMCFSVTHMKLVFYLCRWERKLNFEEFCARLRNRCPILHTMILHNAIFSESLPSVIDACSEFLPNLRTLTLHECVFGYNYPQTLIYGRSSKIENLDISRSKNVRLSSLCAIGNMPCLKKLNLYATCIDNSWFWNKGGSPFLLQLETLNLGCLSVDTTTFSTIQRYCNNLNELFLCGSQLKDVDFEFKGSVFPVLKTICIGSCRDISCISIVGLVNTCESLQNVYVDLWVARSFEEYILKENKLSKLGIVRHIEVHNH